MPSTKNPKRLRHPVREYLLDRAGRRDLDNVHSSFPNFASLQSLMLPIMKQLRSAHQEYITDVSVDYMAASLESSALLCCLMDICQPSHMIDLGSGFSSFAIRSHAERTGNNVTIYSADDSPEWLEKTREYLQAHQCNSDNLLTWQQCTDTDLPHFDLVFHDMGDMALREAALPWVFGQLTSSGIVVLDDMHKTRYRQAAVGHMATTGINAWSLRELTFDSLGRFAYLASHASVG